MRISDWSSDVCSSDLEKVIARFKADRDDAYEEFIDKCDDFEREVAKEVEDSHFTYAELEENDVDLKKLQGWMTKIRERDLYGEARAAEGGERLQGWGAWLEAERRRRDGGSGGKGQHDHRPTPATD